MIFSIFCFCLIAFVQSNSAFSYTNTDFPTSSIATIQKTFNHIEDDNKTHSIYVATSNQELTTTSQRKRVDLSHQNSFDIISETAEINFTSNAKHFYKNNSYTPPKLFLTELYINAP